MPPRLTPRGSAIAVPLHSPSRYPPAPSTPSLFSGDLEHPLSPSLPCPILQYTDDTLIIIKGDLQQLIRLKDILEAFSSFSGLHINFDKSTFIPMNLPTSLSSQMANVLGCAISSFPQPYLGLPLSPAKVRMSDLQPLLDRFDSYFVRWRGHLPSRGAAKS